MERIYEVDFIKRPGLLSSTVDAANFDFMERH
jgi:hypothetical protein